MGLGGSGRKAAIIHAKFKLVRLKQAEKCDPQLTKWKDEADNKHYDLRSPFTCEDAAFLRPVNRGRFEEESASPRPSRAPVFS
jgi:hypothetical protein